MRGFLPRMPAHRKSAKARSAGSERSSVAPRPGVLRFGVFRSRAGQLAVGISPYGDGGYGWAGRGHESAGRTAGLFFTPPGARTSLVGLDLGAAAGRDPRLRV